MMMLYSLFREMRRAGLVVSHGAKLVDKLAVGPHVHLATGDAGTAKVALELSSAVGLWPRAQNCFNRGRKPESSGGCGGCQVQLEGDESDRQLWYA